MLNRCRTWWHQIFCSTMKSWVLMLACRSLFFSWSAVANTAERLWRQCSSSGGCLRSPSSSAPFSNTGSRDWDMMPGRIGSKGNPAVTDPKYNLKKAPFSNSLPASAPYSQMYSLSSSSLLFFPGLKLAWKCKETIRFERLIRSAYLNDMLLRL